MASLKPTQSIHADMQRAIISFTIGGYWTPDAMRAFLFELGEAAKPLMKRHEPFSAMGDLTEFVPQDRETAAAIRDSILAGQRNGLQRFAVVNPAALVKLQYKRITEGVEVEFFSDAAKARHWLNTGEQDDGAGRSEPMPNPITS